MAVKKGWHCAYDVHYHIVFPVKYRKALISREIEVELVRIAGEISEQAKNELAAICPAAAAGPLA